VGSERQAVSPLGSWCDFSGSCLSRFATLHFADSRVIVGSTPAPGIPRSATSSTERGKPWHHRRPLPSRILPACDEAFRRRYALPSRSELVRWAASWWRSWGPGGSSHFPYGTSGRSSWSTGSGCPCYRLIRRRRPRTRDGRTRVARRRVACCWVRVSQAFSRSALCSSARDTAAV